MLEHEFINEIAEIIEAEPEVLTLDSDFRKCADFWSSLTGFGILIFMQEKFSLKIDVEEFLNMNTIGDLYALTKKGDH